MKRKSLECESRGKRLEVATHFIHPDEISIESLDIITELTQHGIAVYVQTPLLKDCNDKGKVLVELYEKLRGAGAEMHYLYLPCSPIRGNRRYVAPISTAIDLASYLRAYLSDRAIPRFCTATTIGKIDWNLSGWAVEGDKSDDRYIWIRTPYTQDYFSQFAPILQLQKVARVNPEGTLDTKFMADIGDDSLYFGSRTFSKPDLTCEAYAESVANKGNEVSALHSLKAAFLQDQRVKKSLAPTGTNTLFRSHKTVVELDIGAGKEEMKKNITYIQNNEEITDVLLTSREDIISHLYQMKAIFKKLDSIPHVKAIRIKSLNFNYQPDLYTPAVINLLGKLNYISIANPRRLEIETQFLQADEMTPKHKELAISLGRKGITVYNNTPLLPLINLSEDEIGRLAYGCRWSGIEFHHLYIAGHPVQADWCETHPIELSIIIDIATALRRKESGRGIPRFIISTPLGDVDFGLCSEATSDQEGRIYIKLKPYCQEYYQSMDRSFAYPVDIKVGKDGHPIIMVPGLAHTRDFMLNKQKDKT